MTPQSAEPKDRREEILAELRPEEHAARQAEKQKASVDKEPDPAPVKQEDTPEAKTKPEVRPTQGSSSQEEPGISA